MNAAPPLGASARPPAPKRLRRTISVETDVCISDFDDEVILEAADLIRSGANPAGWTEDAHDIAHRAYLAICYGDPAEERRLARELIGQLIGRIL